MATIRDVAALAKVSVATVSRVLNGSAMVSNETKDKVLKAQKELNFVLNASSSSLTKRNSEVVGLLVTDLSDPFFGVMVKACEDTAHANQQIMVVTQGLLDEQRELLGIKSLLSQDCAALVFYPQASSDEVLRKYLRVFSHLVLVNRSLPGFEERCLMLDNQQGMYTGVKYLIALGHRDIAYIGSSQPTTEARQRYAGFEQALSESDLTPNPELVLRVQPNLDGGALAAQELFRKRGQFSAVVCYNDSLAAAVLSSFNTQGLRVPHEVSVLGFDDIFFAPLLSPPLTSIRNPIVEMAKSAVELSSAIYHKRGYRLPEFTTELVIRDSVKAMN
ncbi:MAG: LacI family DNA-binding transcriptional regulator [Succinivibrio sp.]|nr:LacI family DNA-binding transcriptional regulator [Succinivibrio sp.]